jgi:hypothetical protein
LPACETSSSLASLRADENAAHERNSIRPTPFDAAVRLVLSLLVFLASLIAAVFVHAARADAAWEAPQSLDSGQGPHVRISGETTFIGYAKPPAYDPSELLVTEGNEPTTRVRVPRQGRVVAFDIDAQGRLVALRDARRDRRSPRRVVAYENGRWRALSSASSSAVDAQLAVADSGAAVAAWLQYEGRRVVVHAAVRPRGARRFGPAQRISGLTSRTPQPLALAVDDDATAVVAFTEAGDLTMARTVGASFTPPVRIHDRTATTAGAFASAAAIRGDTAVVAFTRLEDREPPEYRLSAATQVGDTAPLVETVATNVSALEVAAAVSVENTPLALGAPIGPPHSLRLHQRTGAWAQAAAYPAGEAPSTIGLAVSPIARGPVCVTWTEGTSGFATVGGDRLALGRASNPDCAVHVVGRAFAVWDQGPRRPLKIATFTP